jgi:hypothetical protein
MVSLTLRPLYPRGKSPQYPLDRRLGGPQSQSGRHGEMKILAPTRAQTPTPGHPARSQSLYRLRYPGSRRMVILVICFAQNKISKIFPRTQQNICFFVLWRIEQAIYIASNTIKHSYETESVFCWCCSAIRGLAPNSKAVVIQISE